METQTYAILNEQGGWLENTVLWDGDTTKWQCPAGTVAVPIGDVDLSALPENPANVPSYYAIEWMDLHGYNATQMVAFVDVESKLRAANKTSAKMSAVRAWADIMLGEYVDNPNRHSNWPTPPHSFADAITEAVLLLT